LGAFPWYHPVILSEVVYRSEVRIERVKGAVRRAYLPTEPGPVIFGVHGAVAEHYKVPPAVLEPHATTLDYIVAAAAGWLTGTFGGALEARQVDASNERLVSEAVGEVELEDNVLVIRRIHVILKLRALGSQRETASRVHGFYVDRCPIYRSLKPAIAITTELVFDALPA
jgi:uncharacterized OsmC-like protein